MSPLTASASLTQLRYRWWSSVIRPFACLCQRCCCAHYNRLPNLSGLQRCIPRRCFSCMAVSYGSTVLQSCEIHQRTCNITPTLTLCWQTTLVGWTATPSLGDSYLLQRNDDVIVVAMTYWPLSWAASVEIVSVAVVF